MYLAFGVRSNARDYFAARFNPIRVSPEILEYVNSYVDQPLGRDVDGCMRRRQEEHNRLCPDLYDADSGERDHIAGRAQSGRSSGAHHWPDG